MKAEKPPAGRALEIFCHVSGLYRQGAGQGLLSWGLVAILGFAALIVLRRRLEPGEFGTLNTALTLAGLLTVPVTALPLAFASYLAREHGPAAAGKDRMAACLGAGSGAGFYARLGCGGDRPDLGPVSDVMPARFTLHLFTLLDLLLMLGGVASGALCLGRNRLGLWAFLLVMAAVVRFVVALVLGAREPWAESGMAASVAAGVILFAPILRQTELDLGWVAGMAGAARS